LGNSQRQGSLEAAGLIGVGFFGLTSNPKNLNPQNPEEPEPGEPEEPEPGEPEEPEEPEEPVSSQPPR
jgi:hypothetical protein